MTKYDKITIPIETHWKKKGKKNLEFFKNEWSSHGQVRTMGTRRNQQINPLNVYTTSQNTGKSVQKKKKKKIPSKTDKKPSIL